MHLSYFGFGINLETLKDKMLVKGKLGRICKQCNKRFIPSGGRNCKLCYNCQNKNMKIKTIKQLEKAELMKKETFKY